MEKIQIYVEEASGVEIIYDIEHNSIRACVDPPIRKERVIKQILRNFNYKEVLNWELTGYNLKDEMEKELCFYKSEKDIEEKVFQFKRKLETAEISIASITYYTPEEAIQNIPQDAHISPVISFGNNFTLYDVKKVMDTISLPDDVEYYISYNNGDTITKKELKEVVDFYTGICDYIKHFNLSPLEQCILLNDLLKEREYKPSTSTDSSDSRSVSKIYKSDEIVCAGFAKMYETVLTLLGVDTYYVTYGWKDKIGGHATNAVCINDDKYDVHGIVEVDTTWGREYDQDERYDYLKSRDDYTFFGRSLAGGFRYRLKTSGLNKRNIQNPDLERFYETFARYEKLKALNAPLFALRDEIKIRLNILKKLYEKCGGKNFDIYTKCEEYLNKPQSMVTSDDLEELIYQAGKFERIVLGDIDREPLLQAIKRVRMIELSIDKDRFPLQEDDIAKIESKRFPKTSEERLLDCIFGEKENSKTPQIDELEQERMKLLSVLHRAAGDDININPTQPKM